MLKHASVAAFLSTASAAGFKNVISDQMKVSSPAARTVQASPRELKNNYYGTWMTDYSLIFDSCYTLPYMSENAAEQDEYGVYSSPVANQVMIKYRLCDSNACGSSCVGGEYVTSGMEFVESYVQFKMNAKEQTCAIVEETCEGMCENGQVYNANSANYYWQDDAYCLQQCLADKNFSYCYDDGAEKFEAANYLECVQTKNDYYNNGGNGQQYYIGPVCGNGGSEIRLQMFSDETCTTAVDNSYFANNNNYGLSTLPYSQESVVAKECLSCKEAKDNNGNNNYYDYQDADEVAEMCEQVYEASGHCESNLNVNKPQKDSCNFINNVLPSLAKALNGSSSKRSSSKASSGGGGTAAKVFAWIFFFSTCGLAYYVFFLIKKMKNGTMASLDHNGGTSA